MKETFGLKEDNMSIFNEEFHSKMREMLKTRRELVKIELSEISLFLKKPETLAIDFTTNVFSKFTELEDFRKIWGKDDLEQVEIKNFAEYVGLPLQKVKFPFKEYPVPGFMEPILEDVLGQDETPFPLQHYAKDSPGNFMYILGITFDSVHTAPNGVAVTIMAIDLGDLKDHHTGGFEMAGFPDMIEEIYQKKGLVEFASKRISGLKRLILQWASLIEVDELLESLGAFLFAQKETLTEIVLDLEQNSVADGYPWSILANPEDEDDSQRILYRVITNNCPILKKLIVYERSGDEGNSFDKLFPFPWKCEIEKRNSEGSE